MVSAIRAKKNAPFAVTNINREELETFSRTGQELPFLFARTPGVMAWGENGTGIGPVYMRIRGAGDSRINVTLDGVPLNSPEDQCVFWANMNSYAALLGSVQIQRGVGTSTNGDGAFGGTISLSSRSPQLTGGAEVTGSFGSLNTWRAGMRFSTGLLANHLVIEGAYNTTATQGFVNGTDGRSGSAFIGLTWMNDHLCIRYKNLSNWERMGQAWNGIIAGDYDGYNPLDASYAELFRQGLGRLNSLYEHIYDDHGTIKSERYKMRDGSLWDRTTDNFWQDHNILSLAWDVSPHWTVSATAHYTYGYGYYDEFRYNHKLSKYGLPTFTLSDLSTLKKTDFVRRKGLRQDTYGLLWNFNYKDDRWDVIGGMNLQTFEANHFGYLTYMANEELERAYLSNGDYQYYDSDATKNDFSTFLKASFAITPEWSIFADMQFRHVMFMTGGYNDKYHSDLSKNMLNIRKTYNFANPKIGASFSRNGHKAYASIAMSHREPERNNFTDNSSYPAPKAERLIDYELGYSFNCHRWHAGVNLYYMDYRDQFVQTGAVSDIGEALTTNIARSYRLGAELTAGVRITDWLSLDGNLALSRNCIKDFDEVIGEVFDASWNTLDPIVNHYSNSTLAYSPSLIGNVFLDFRHKGFSATWRTGGVSRMFVDNSECTDRSIPGYCTSDFNASYTFRIDRALKSVLLGVNINNVFNSHFAQSGFVWYQSIVAGKRSSQMSYIPSAGITVMGSVTLKF